MNSRRLMGLVRRAECHTLAHRRMRGVVRHSKIRPPMSELGSWAAVPAPRALSLQDLGKQTLRRRNGGALECTSGHWLAGRGRDASYLAPPAQSRTCGFPAYGSHLGSKRQAVAVCVPAPVTREPGAESSACFASPHSPWSTPFAPPTPLRLTPPRTAPQWGATLFAGFTATMAGSDFSCPCIIGYGSSPSRCGPSRSRNI
jgi:hypothetical protein